MRIGIRLKLVFLSLFLFTIPWLGYQYVWELESYLRLGQEQSMLGTARAVATALHERPKLFDSQSAYLSDVRTGTDLYAHPIVDPIRLDGKLDDWLDYRHLALAYGQANLLEQTQPYQPHSLQFEHMVGQYGQYLYAMFAVQDQQVLFRPGNSLRVDRNDHLQIALLDPDGIFRRYIVAPQAEGWVNAYLLDENPNSLRPTRPETRIQGQWRNTKQGYNIELRFPLGMVASQIAFALIDVDNPDTRERQFVVGTANPNNSDQLGTVLVPSPEIERILKGLKHANARVWVLDKHRRVLARSGSIHHSTGTQDQLQEAPESPWWQWIEQHWLLPLYYQILTRPPMDFVDELQNAYALQGQNIAKALTGTEASQWRLSPDNKAVILSAAHPIFIDEQVMGAVVVEQTTHGIRTLRNRALEGLFHLILAVMGLGTLALFVFASRISFRIRKLRNQTEAAIDQQGRIIGHISPSKTKDEIGDLSRSFNTVLGKLKQYNHYLENMASRLSHELRTPTAIVKSSLENMANENSQSENQAYQNRALQGVKRLSSILTNMSEATRLEQAMQGHEPEAFSASQVLQGCVQGYQAAYPKRKFSLKNQIDKTQSMLQGAPELFAQMLDKIVTNAIEFSQPGDTIQLSLSQHGQQQQLCISNPGPLLPENMQSQLLDSMVSVRNAQSAQTEGSDADKPHLGLGLYIAKLIAEYHGGQITIQNRPEQDGVQVLVVFG